MSLTKNRSSFNTFTSSGVGYATVVLGTPQSLNFYSKWQEDPLSVVQCYSITEEPYPDVSIPQYIAELTPVFNPSTGCQYPMADYFSNTTDFEEDNLWSDSDSLRYFLTPDATNYFSQTFSTSGLEGDQFVVACTAFCLQELGYTFNVVVHAEETSLIKFCKTRDWNYKIVGTYPHPT